MGDPVVNVVRITLGLRQGLGKQFNRYSGVSNHDLPVSTVSSGDTRKFWAYQR
jgi:hypothetical protein